MINTIKTQLKNYINKEISHRMNCLSEDISHQRNMQLWEDQVAINACSKKFGNLSDVSEYRDDEPSFIKPEDLGLEKSVDTYVDNDKFPLPSAQDREGYGGDRHFEYWLSGLGDYLSIKKHLKTHGCELQPGGSIYDMGCASGRVIRHFLCQEKELELWASDINSNHLEWILKYLGKDIKVFQNHSLPHLPLEDNSLDLIYAFSVFSHLDTFESAWLLELRRMLKPGGYAYLTTHTDNTWSVIRQGDTIYDLLLGHPDFSPDLLKSKMPSQRMVYRWRADRCYSANVFHSTEHIRNVWGRYFEIQEIIRGGHFYQDVILLRKH